NLYTGGEVTGKNGAAPAGRGTSSFAAGGTFPLAPTTLWANVDKMLGYDIMMLSCEGGQYPDFKLPYVANMKKYMDSGGRLFNSHLHFYWLAHGPAPLPMTGAYNVGAKLAPDNNTLLTATVDQTFPKGMALAQWL